MWGTFVRVVLHAENGRLLMGLLVALCCGPSIVVIAIGQLSVAAIVLVCVNMAGALLSAAYGHRLIRFNRQLPPRMVTSDGKSIISFRNSERSSRRDSDNSSRNSYLAPLPDIEAQRKKRAEKSGGLGAIGEDAFPSADDTIANLTQKWHRMSMMIDEPGMPSSMMSSSSRPGMGRKSFLPVEKFPHSKLRGPAVNMASTPMAKMLSLLSLLEAELSQSAAANLGSTLFELKQTIKNHENLYTPDMKQELDRAESKGEAEHLDSNVRGLVMHFAGSEKKKKRRARGGLRRRASIGAQGQIVGTLGQDPRQRASKIARPMVRISLGIRCFGPARRMRHTSAIRPVAWCPRSEWPLQDRGWIPSRR